MPQLDSSKVIINLTDEQLDEDTTSVLTKGLNYAVAPKRIPTEEVISAVETAIKDIPNSSQEEIRQDVAVILRKAKPPVPNLSRNERNALKKLKEDDSKLVLSADKGNATVVMDVADYKRKMLKMLEDGPYKSVRNPTQRINKSVQSAVKSSESINENAKKFLVNSDPRPPLLYGLPKVHKEGIPMRPIVSSIGSPTYNVAGFIARQLSDYVGRMNTFVKDSRHFIEIIKNICLEDEDLLVSFDVESLFTKVSIPETTEIICEILNHELANLAKLCLYSTYFYFDGGFYEQIEGAAMGSPLSPVAANLYMERFEQMALENANFKPKVWLRYVDDVWAVWPHGRNNLELFLDHLNSQHPNIRFTMEIEDNKKLPFLDVLTSRKPDGTIGHAVYRKPTHTNRYLNANSHHHPAQKNSVLNTLFNRAIYLSDKTSWNQEKHTLKTTLLKNGYANEHINKALRMQINKCQSTENTQIHNPEDRGKTMRAYLPYIKGTTDKIGRILNRHNIKPVFKPHKKINNLLRPVKDKIPLSTPGVYEIPCSCGSVYIGETKRLISTRLKEHIRSTKNKDIKSAVAEHSDITKHGILFDETRVLATTPYYYPRIVREAIEIRKNKNNFNRDDSFRLARAWNPVIEKLKMVRE